MKLKTVKRDGTNERACIVIDSAGKPIDHICWFTTNELAKWANSTQKRITNNVLHIEKWAESKGLNLIDEFNSNCLLDSKKYKSFIKHLERFTQDTGAVTSIAPRMVIPKYFNDRIDTSILYFDYLVRRAVESRRTDDPKVEQLEKKFEKLKEKLNNDKRPKDDV